jgi:hypothetical protein
MVLVTMRTRYLSSIIMHIMSIERFKTDDDDDDGDDEYKIFITDYIGNYGKQ